jgi:ankyrin repeat protein
VEVLICGSTVQVFREGQYMGEYVGCYEGAMPAVGAGAGAPMFAERPSYEAATMKSAPQMMMKSAPQTMNSALQKSAMDRTPARLLALQNAVLGGDPVAVKALLDQGVDPDEPAENGKVPLVLAAQKGKVAVVEVLLAAGADPNKSGKDGSTALAVAYETGNKEVLSKLFSATFRNLGSTAPRDAGPICSAAAAADNEVPANAHDNLREVTLKLSALSPQPDQEGRRASRSDHLQISEDGLEHQREEAFRMKLQAFAA